MLEAAGLDEGTSPVQREVDKGHARVGALLDAGLIPEAEADMRGAPRLRSLISFAAPVTHGLNAAREAGLEARAYAFVWRLMLKVCEAWHDGLRDMEPVREGSMRFDSMFIHRCQMVRNVHLALFSPDTDYEAALIEAVYMLAEEGWFLGFREKVREAVGLLRGMCNDTLADRLEGHLAAETMEQQQYAAYDAAMGYARPAA